jgi:hypothetical protein
VRAGDPIGRVQTVLLVLALLLDPTVMALTRLALARGMSVVPVPTDPAASRGPYR